MTLPPYRAAQPTRTPGRDDVGHGGRIELFERSGIRGDLVPGCADGGAAPGPPDL